MSVDNTLMCPTEAKEGLLLQKGIEVKPELIIKGHKKHIEHDRMMQHVSHINTILEPTDVYRKWHP